MRHAKSGPKEKKRDSVFCFVHTPLCHLCLFWLNPLLICISIFLPQVFKKSVLFAIYQTEILPFITKSTYIMKMLNFCKGELIEKSVIDEVSKSIKMYEYSMSWMKWVYKYEENTHMPYEFGKKWKFLMCFYVTVMSVPTAALDFITHSHVTWDHAHLSHVHF